MINNIQEFKKSLLKNLIEKTEKYEIEWKWFTENFGKVLEEKHSIFYLENTKRLFPYNNEDILSDFPENYKIIAEESMFVTIKYYKKKKKLKEKKLRYGLIKGYNADAKTGENMLSLVCDKKSARYYIPIITSNSSEKFHEELEKLYYLAEFKMYSEMKIIEKWISGNFDEDAKQFKKQEAENKLKKRENKSLIDTTN